MTIFECLIDPKWQWGKLKFDGSEHIFVTLIHSKHGEITALLPRDVARSMGDALVSLSK